MVPYIRLFWQGFGEPYQDSVSDNLYLPYAIWVVDLFSRDSGMG
jgi:hypothetical protein